MLRRLLFSLAAFAALMFAAVHPASAQQRIALVIGNGAYPKGPIEHSLADGGLVAEALTSIGFEIVEGADVNQTDLRRVFRDFLAKVQAAGPDTIAFVYYSGYGIEFEGENYLVPVDARLDRDSDIPIDAIRLFDLLRPLADTPATTKIVVLDAARPLPFQIQGGALATGLGAVEAAPGLLVAFSSAPGTTAADGPGAYGAYATAIAEMVREPGLDIDTMFARIRLRTNEATNGAQTPWEVSQLQQVAMLVPGQATAPPSGTPQGLIQAPQTQIGAPVVRRRPPPRPLQDLGPEQAYAYAVEQDDLQGYSDYVRVYPDGPYSQRIWAVIRARREALLWRRVLLENSPDAYWTYIQRYPDGMYVFDARRRLRRLAAAEGPPSGFRMRMYDDVPMPLSGEPQGFIRVLPPAPPPRRFLAPPPAFIVGLPPPPRPGGGMLWRRPQPAFPVIVMPPGQRPGFTPGTRPQGPQGVMGPPQGQGGVGAGGRPPGGPPPGFQGPPKEWQKPGTGIGNAPPGPPPGQKGPAVVTTPPAGAGGPPPGFKGPPKEWQKPGTGIGSAPSGPPPGQKGPTVVTTPPAGAGGPPPGFKGPPAQGQPKGPAVVNQPPAGSGGGAGPQPGFKGPPKEWQKPGTGIGNAPSAPKGPAVVNQPPAGSGGASGAQPGFKGPPAGGPPPQLRASPPPQLQQPRPPQVSAPPPPQPPKAPPPPPPPMVKGPPPGPPPGAPPQVKGPVPGTKGPPGLPKCAVTGGKQPCAP